MAQRKMTAPAKRSSMEQENESDAYKYKRGFQNKSTDSLAFVSDNFNLIAMCWSSCLTWVQSRRSKPSGLRLAVPLLAAALLSADMDCTELLEAQNETRIAKKE